MRQGGVVAQLAILVTRNVVYLPDSREHFRLLDRVDPEIRFQIQIEIEHIQRIARLFHHQSHYPFLNRIALWHRLSGGGYRCGRLHLRDWLCNRLAGRLSCRWRIDRGRGWL